MATVATHSPAEDGRTTSMRRLRALERRQRANQQSRWGPARAFKGLRHGLGATASGLSRALRRQGGRRLAGSRRQAALPPSSAEDSRSSAWAEQGSWNHSFQLTVDRIATGMSEGLALLTPKFKPLELRATAASLQERAAVSSRQSLFPQTITENGSNRELAATGHRTWGSWWDGRGLLNVKIYDFALYVDKDKVRRSQFGRRFRNRKPSQLRDDYYAGMRSSSDFGLSLLVRTNLPLPIGMMAREYERILRKRIEKLGGDRHDPHLDAMLECFKEDNLPDHVKRGPGTVRKGTLLTFHRTEGGGLAAKANHELLGETPSPRVSGALFDLYLGDNPVHGRAKKEAGKQVLNIIRA
mmetsp:Transcript_1936/g.5708  ORF Transcript_1936/g.5708 Transcript_1936/m.5708 type:complete len:355 (-) Transcript_1936:826-1890(-)|eukprot:CAMPEP_0117671548 /NCGR_PEP_ID=MMETSP0804-20121206/13395_1 /TAXON_ID=1074897 /ORGANISM="Tetraselmis astigmatica, Strain CCMP880" /LENGTH=354 /DNA_ID=CAMNT_0005480021 /DNA_START=90 /DNA_END=1154 /DNA_ORIENTATION=-